MARLSEFYPALCAMVLALSAPPLLAQSSQQPTVVLTPAEQAHLDGMKAQLEAEQNKIGADYNALLRDQAVLTPEELKRRQDGIQARMLQLQASQKQAQAWLDSIVNKPAAAAPPGQSVRLTIKPTPAESAAPMVNGKELTAFTAAGKTYVLRAYKEWVLAGSGPDGKPVVFDEVGRSINWVLIRRVGENSPNWVIDLVKREFRNGGDRSATPIVSALTDVTGINLIRVTYQGGRIAMLSKGNWVEVSRGKIVGRFTEIDRNSNSVTIADFQRGLYLVLRLVDRSIHIGTNGSEATRPLYAMTSVSATFEEPRAVID